MKDACELISVGESMEGNHLPWLKVVSGRKTTWIVSDPSVR